MQAFHIDKTGNSVWGKPCDGPTEEAGGLRVMNSLTNDKDLVLHPAKK